MSKLRILHSSDLHGNWRLPTQFKDFDLWIDSGDYFPNVSRGKSIEASFQRDWMTTNKLKLKRHYMPIVRDMHVDDPAPTKWYPSDSRQPPFDGSVAARLAEWLSGRPALTVPGNHDFTDLAEILGRAGAKAVNLTKSPASVFGLIFAGMREIPRIEGEWAGEADDAQLSAAVSRVMSQDPDVLVTHAPASGILDCAQGGAGHVGISPLTTWLAYRPHTVRLVLCGHVHEHGGDPLVEEMGITFSNAAQVARIIEIEI